MQSRAGRPDRDAEGLGDLGQRQPEVVVQDEDSPVLDRHAPEGAIERIALDDRDKAVGTDRPVDRQDPDVGRPRPTTPGLGVAGMDEHPTQPGLEAGRVAECRELTPGGDEGALQGVLREVGVAQDPGRDRVHPVAGRMDQLRECLAIPIPCANDEIVHRVSLCDRAGCGTITPNESAPPRNVHRAMRGCTGGGGWSSQTSS